MTFEIFQDRIVKAVNEIPLALSSLKLQRINVYDRFVVNEPVSLHVRHPEISSKTFYQYDENARLVRLELVDGSPQTITLNAGDIITMDRINCDAKDVSVNLTCLKIDTLESFPCLEISHCTLSRFIENGSISKISKLDLVNGKLVKSAIDDSDLYTINVIHLPKLIPGEDNKHIELRNLIDSIDINNDEQLFPYGIVGIYCRGTQKITWNNFFVDVNVEENNREGYYYVVSGDIVRNGTQDCYLVYFRLPNYARK